MAKIVVKNLKKDFKDNSVLKDFSFICDNEIVFLAAKNGEGKTTFIRIALGLDVPSSGSLEFLDGESTISNSDIGVVLDSSIFYNNLSGYHNISILCTGYLKDKEYVNNIFKELNLNEELLKKKVHKYSFGQKHRLCIAMALIKKPKILFLDEPTIGLDPDSWELVKKYILKFKKNNDACVIVTGQDYSEMSSFADKILILSDGENKLYEDINVFLKKAKKQVVLTTNSKKLPEKLLSISTRQEHSDKEHIYYFDSDKKEMIMELCLKNKIEIISLNINNFDLKDAFLQIIKK